ncbi:hypothetical protein TCAL_04767 [Tigriopus californicus]|uniref:G-protein coupled receptors family 1 profile domain-containing protein n=1 Tax=Tigriopus californicus TaxID=6832 RepID=A0A553P459_TIGCA|nr:alpha-1A adrenergic receptor-like [Tigriopus californicus]TRY72471.1 hypothetical protein TCAL_04767 [Tigriopus californicus]|eukprot:TCALIF_04767-PA protein Name:"Similar to dop-4 Dopamine receptor 4 (Caenorhabditis elegans)" AED:0.13 eAED:0.14 QI:0/-1/0/1/-1/1/1/0/496
MLHNDTGMSVSKIGNVTILSSIGVAFFICPIVILSNLLVILPFGRARRIRSAPNQLILALAITDLVAGIIIPLSAIFQSFSDLFSDDVSFHTIRQTFLSLLFVVEVANVLLLTSIALDKVISLAKPLHYSDIVTFGSVKVFFVGVIVALLILGTLFTFSHGSTMQMFYLDSATIFHSVLLFGLSLPCGIILAYSYYYVYVIANRHAKDIQEVAKVVRNKEMGDYRHNFVNKGEDAKFLLPPNPKFMQSRRSTCSSSSQPSSSSVSTRRFNFHSTLMVMVVSFAVSKFLCPLGVIVCDFFDGLIWLQRVFFLPIFLQSAINPWLYGYHNIDIKPQMRRIIRRILRKMGLTTTVDRCLVKFNATFYSLNQGTSRQAICQKFNGFGDKPFNTFNPMATRFFQENETRLDVPELKVQEDLASGMQTEVFLTKMGDATARPQIHTEIPTQCWETTTDRNDRSKGHEKTKRTRNKKSHKRLRKPKVPIIVIWLEDPRSGVQV